MRITLCLSRRGALEGDGQLRHALAFNSRASICGRFIPWERDPLEAPRTIEIPDGELPPEVLEDLCFSCRRGIEEAIAQVLRGEQPHIGVVE